MSSKKISYLGIFVALEIIATRFFALQLTPTMRIGFGFLPVAISGFIFGPLTAGLIAVAADLLGMMIFPTGGAFFPGFTLSAFLTGIAYSVFLYKRPRNFKNILLAAVTVCVLINLGIDTLWLKIMYGKAYFAMLPARALKNFAMIPVQVIVMTFIEKTLKKTLDDMIESM